MLRQNAAATEMRTFDTRNRQVTAMTHQRTIRILSADNVRQALPMSDAITIMKSAFVALSQGDAVLPPRSHIEVPDQRGTALFMPSYLPACQRLGLKVATLFDNNHQHDLPRLQSVMLLVDGSTGSPLAVLDGATLTAIRTGAASGAATDILARRDAAVVAVFGAGVQGRTQLEAVSCVRSIRLVYIVDPNQEAAQSLASQMSQCLNVQILIGDKSDLAVREADIICTATASATPVFVDRDVELGTHINAIGSYKPEVQEIPEKTVARARIVVDHRASALDEAGDLIIALQKGLIRREDLQTELGDVISGRASGRSSDDEITLFKSVGVGVQDLAAASFVYNRALELNLGVDAPL